MPPSNTRPPLAYHPAAEQPPPGEAAAIAAIDASMHAILQTTWADYGHAVRSVHAKSHGLLQGELQVLEGLPDRLAQGVFASPRSYPVVLRISTNPGDILDDTVSAPRGLAIKLIGVEGERLPGSEGNATQDFVMANSPAFVAPDARAFSASLGVTASGRLDFGRKLVALNGTIVPAYFFNALPGRIPLIGRLFSPEKGSGLFAANYTLNGSLTNPSMSINPLSALTPGFLRGFFDLF